MKRPDRVVLQGRHVKIVPLHAATHAAALYVGSKDAGLWRYLFNGPYTDEAEFRAWLEGRETFSQDGKGRGRGNGKVPKYFRAAGARDVA